MYSLKFKADGTSERLKARLVVKGYSQTAGLDYNETFSLVAKLNSVQVLISLAINMNWPLHQLDVKNAFLHGDLLDEVFMQQPRRFVVESESHTVCKLNKLIYGFKQSPCAWFDKLSNILTEFGFVGSVSDYSMFVKKTTRGYIILIVYVDDIIVSSGDNIGIQETISWLHSKVHIKDLG